MSIATRPETDSTQSEKPDVNPGRLWGALVERLGGLRVVSPACCLILLTIACFGPAITYDFVNWDDPWYVVDNEMIKSWAPGNLYQIATEIAIRNYAPLNLYSYLVDHTLWGLWPGGYHLTNILLHAMNAALVYVLLLRFVPNRTVAFVAAALFAVHPVHVESVVWISSRKGLLSATFMLASLLCWLRPERTTRQEIWGLSFLVLALLTKIIAVMVPPIVLLYDVFIVKKTKSESVARQFIPGLLAAWLLIINMSAQNSELGGVRGHLDLSRLEILQIDAVILWHYVGMLLWPQNLSVLYDPATSGLGGMVWLAIAGWGLVASGAWCLRNRLPQFGWALAIMLLCLLPVLNLFPITTLMNDRYLYLPSIPFFALLAAALSQCVGWIGQRLGEAIESRRALLDSALSDPNRVRWAFLMTGLLLVVTYTSKTAAYMPVWRNGMSLWTYTIEQVPQLAVVQIQMANTLHAEGETQAAISHLEYALANCSPDQLDRQRIEQKLSDWQKN
ncbi:hypothetical protein Pla110_40010 [Polystyrenella longa]|uniref:Glycosyltransferase RgtA/B/C/D-like domain-containing protein n=1 Tax=Polystyrenella longa TaxID=2528007 RepID=A0A518CSQ3_9PLAN|nr:hypothetical protein [Polystyrenella longa]QDU82246.1 hypothetical protein Pla110_40010 [Polystyrenella longa]